MTTIYYDVQTGTWGDAGQMRQVTLTAEQLEIVAEIENDSERLEYLEAIGQDDNQDEIDARVEDNDYRIDSDEYTGPTFREYED